MRTTLEIGANVPALLIGGELHGVFVQVRLGLDGLPHFLVFPKMVCSIPNIAFEISERPECAVPPPSEFIEIRYRLYDDVPAKYLHESEWRGNDDDDGPNEYTPTPSPGLLVC